MCVCPCFVVVTFCDTTAVQTACTTVKHLSLGVAMLGCEDALVHLLNFVWPNIFETSPHVINAVFEAIEVGCLVSAVLAVYYDNGVTAVLFNSGWLL